MTEPAPPPTDSGQLVSSFPMQAIVVVHGMGEQKPMDTIRGFARSVWASDPGVWSNDPKGPSDPGGVWSKPDTRTGSLELRRLTTRSSRPSADYPKGTRQDFYELYWADQSGGSTWDKVKNWVWMLLFRNPISNVPRRVLSAWLLLWIVVVAIVVLVVAASLPRPGSAEIDAWSAATWRLWPFSCLIEVPRAFLAGAVAVLSFGAHGFVVPYFGRVVRYTRALPDNVAARKAIRERGLALLKELHKQDYDRIVVVGHSLGSIVAYDLVSYFWAGSRAAHTVDEGSDEFKALCRLEAQGAGLAAEQDADKRTELVGQWHVAQRAFGRLLRRRPRPADDKDVDRRWLITDLITVGSPLGHADFLLAADAEDRARRIAERELAVCPPQRETVDPDECDAAKSAGLPLDDAKPALFCFRPDKSKKRWQLHHAAQFAAMKWTNIHDPSRAVFLGDVISSPAAPIFGPGVDDIDLRALRGQSWGFTHNDYWLDGTPTPEALVKLRDALDLASTQSR